VKVEMMMTAEKDRRQRTRRQSMGVGETTGKMGASNNSLRERAWTLLKQTVLSSVQILERLVFLVLLLVLGVNELEDLCVQPAKAEVRMSSNKTATAMTATKASKSTAKAWGKPSAASTALEALLLDGVATGAASVDAVSEEKEEKEEEEEKPSLGGLKSAHSWLSSRRPLLGPLIPRPMGRTC
jgi:hypothetical protein